MIVDASALIAILRDEIDASKEPIASRHMDDLVVAAGLAIEAVTADQAKVARAAYRQEGPRPSRGSGRRSAGCRRTRPARRGHAQRHDLGLLEVAADLAEAADTCGWYRCQSANVSHWPADPLSNP